MLNKKKNINLLKYTAALTIVTALLLLLCCCSPSSNSYDDSIDKKISGIIIDKNELELNTPDTLTVAISPNYYPFEYSENGYLKGYDVDIAEILATNMGLQLQIKQISFENVFSQFNSPMYRCDLIISALNKTEARENNFMFSNAYYKDKLCVLSSNKQDINESNIDDVLKSNSTRVGVIKSSNSDNEFDKLCPNCKKVLCTSIDDATEKISNNVIDVMLETQNFYRKYKDSWTYCKDFDLYEELYIAFPKDKVNLLKATNTIIDKVFEKSIYEKLCDKYYNL